MVSLVDRRLPRIADARHQTDRLFAMLDPGALYDRPIAERHRIIFYIGHLEAFEWNLLRNSHGPVHPELDQLFAFGIDPVGGGLPTDQPGDWPSVTEVQEFVRHARESVDAIFPEAPDLLANVAIEHRLMHAETLAYMFHRLPLEKKLPPAEPPALPARLKQEGMVEIPEGPATLGLARASD